MKYLLVLSAILLASCQAPQPTAELSLAPAGGDTGGATPTPTITPAPACSLAILGSFQNVSDGIVATITTRNGECGITLSCGFTGYVYPTSNANEYMMIANTAEGDGVGGCALPAQNTAAYGKAGPYYIASFGLFSGQWLGVWIPNETNQWSKL